MSQTVPPEPPNPYAHTSSTAEYRAPQHTGEGDATGGIIPYKNPHALIAYYLGIVALFPLLGVPFGIASFVLGIMGLRNRRKNPAIKGSVHAIVGIVFGIFSMLLGGLIGLAIVIAMFGRRA